MPNSAVAEAANKLSDEELAAGAPAVEQLDDADFQLPSEETAEAEPKLAEQLVEQPAEVVTPPVETAAQRSLRERFADRQINLPGQTDDEALDFISQRVVPYANLGQEVYPHLDSFRKWQAEQAKAAQQPQRSEPEVDPLAELLPALPEYDETWEKAVTRDPETGEVTGVLPWAPPDLAQKVREFEAANINRARMIVQNLPAIIDLRAEQIARKIAAEVSEQRFGVEHQSNFVQQVISQNDEWLYARDDKGNKVPGFNGFPQLSERGNQFAMYVKESYEELGITDPAKQFKYAMRALGPQQAAQVPEDPKVKRTQQLAEQNRERAAKKPNRGGSIPQPGNTPPAEQNEFLTFRQRAAKALEGFEASEITVPS